MRPFVVLLLAWPLAACAETVIEPSATEGSDVSTALTAAPTVPGTRAQQLAALESELARLSERIIEREGDVDALARIEAIWAVLRVDLEREREELVAGFTAVVELARSAVERRRPADADKARLNATALIAAARS